MPRSWTSISYFRIHLTFISNWVVRFTEYDSLQSSLQPWCRQLVKYFAHKLCFLIAHVLHWSIVHEGTFHFFSDPPRWMSRFLPPHFFVGTLWSFCRSLWKRIPTSCLLTDAHSHLLVWTYRERRVGLYATWAFLWVSQRQHHLTDLNSNNKKIIEWLPWSNRFEQRK